jgi:hypothetical protein
MPKRMSAKTRSYSVDHTALVTAPDQVVYVVLGYGCDDNKEIP